MLYSIQFLHQITTPNLAMKIARELYSIQFLHQITTEFGTNPSTGSCIVFNFYIKSQRELLRRQPVPVV